MERVIYDRIRDLESQHWWFVARRRVLNRLIQRLAPPPQANILEVGCGAGGNIPLLQAYGPVTALEPDTDSRAYVAERFGIAVDGGLLPDGLTYDPASFDLICAFDVIEHVEDYLGFAKQLFAVTTLGTTVTVTDDFEGGVMPEPPVPDQETAIANLRQSVSLEPVNDPTPSS